MLLLTYFRRFPVLQRPPRPSVSPVQVSERDRVHSNAKAVSKAIRAESRHAVLYRRPSIANENSTPIPKQAVINPDFFRDAKKRPASVTDTIIDGSAGVGNQDKAALIRRQQELALARSVTSRDQNQAREQVKALPTIAHMQHNLNGGGLGLFNPLQFMSPISNGAAAGANRGFGAGGDWYHADGMPAGMSFFKPNSREHIQQIQRSGPMLEFRAPNGEIIHRLKSPGALTLNGWRAPRQFQGGLDFRNQL